MYFGELPPTHLITAHLDSLLGRVIGSLPQCLFFPLFWIILSQGAQEAR